MDSVYSLVVLLLAVGIVSFAGLLVVALYEEEAVYGFSNGLYVVGSIFLIVFILDAIIFIGFMVYWPDVEREWVKTSEVELVSMRDRDFVEGRFFLGSGYVQGGPYYFYYEKLDDNSYRPGKVRADSRVTIFEEERENGRFEVHEFTVIPEDEWWTFPYNKVSGHKYSFYIPEGSIQRKFHLE
jgi:hypothetical protein